MTRPARDLGQLPSEHRLRTWALERRSARWDGRVRRFTRLGSTQVVCAGVAAASLALELTGARRSGSEAAGRSASGPVADVGILLAGIGLRRLAMATIRRPRPPVDSWLQHTTGYAFPSGHSTNAAMASALITGALWQARADLPGAWLVAAAGGTVYTAAVGGSRVYLGVHWPSDVLAGWTLGLAWTVTGRRMVRRRP